jgi:hypothetical protein
LDGISDDDWPRIEQVVLEVHDLAGRALAITIDYENAGSMSSWIKGQ